MYLGDATVGAWPWLWMLKQAPLPAYCSVVPARGSIALQAPFVKSQLTLSVPKAGSAGQAERCQVSVSAVPLGSRVVSILVVKGLHLVDVWAETRPEAARAMVAAETALENMAASEG